MDLPTRSHRAGRRNGFYELYRGDIRSTIVDFVLKDVLNAESFDRG